MASLVQLRFGEVITRIAKFLHDTYVPSGWDGSNPSDTQYQEAKEIVLDGYSRFLREYPWTFLNKSTTMTAYATVTGTTSGTPSYGATTAGTTTAAAPVYDWPHSIIIATTAIFSESMVGDALAIAGDVAGTYYIDEYISTTQVRVAGDASGEGNSKAITITHRVAYSVVTATAAKFYASMEGQAFVFDTSSASYTIYKYVSTTVIWVKGDASGEAAGDTFTMTADGNYALPDDFASLLGSFSYDSSNPYRDLQERPREIIQAKRSIESAATGYPRYFATRSKPGAPTAQQAWEVMFQPTPSLNQTYYYEYKINPVKPQNYTDLFLGGPEHSITILQACSAQVEIFKGDAAGPQNKMYSETHLPRSMRIDNDKRPRNLGAMRNRSDSMYTQDTDDHRVEVIHVLT